LSHRMPRRPKVPVAVGLRGAALPLLPERGVADGVVWVRLEGALMVGCFWVPACAGMTVVGGNDGGGRE